MKQLLYVLTLLVFSVGLISIEQLHIVVVDASGSQTIVSFDMFTGSKAHTTPTPLPLQPANMEQKRAHMTNAENNTCGRMVHCLPTNRMKQNPTHDV